MSGSSVYSEEQRKFGDAWQQVGVRGLAERREVMRAAQDADQPAPALAPACKASAVSPIAATRATGWTSVFCIAWKIR